ncbi:hypothetical protein ACFWBR_31440 [Streptomyces sp. NPDC060006]|uniref:hypothetical protein n=1 Tax=unclassified Streptomyces TaxID=2593676 RepID=UPI00367A13CD
MSKSPSSSIVVTETSAGPPNPVSWIAALTTYRSPTPNVPKVQSPADAGEPSGRTSRAVAPSRANPNSVKRKRSP